MVPRIEVVEYVTASGRSPFGVWFARLDARAAARVTVALTRMEQGNVPGAKSVGSGVWERRIDFGPGYRVYFGRDGRRLVILLAGGTKQRQQNDIAEARARWEDYRARKRAGG